MRLVLFPPSSIKRFPMAMHWILHCSKPVRAVICTRTGDFLGPFISVPPTRERLQDVVISSTLDDSQNYTVSACRSHHKSPLTPPRTA